MKRMFVVAALGLVFLTAAQAQDMMRGVDLSSPDMVSAEMTRAQVEAAERDRERRRKERAEAKLRELEKSRNSVGGGGGG